MAGDLGMEKNEKKKETKKGRVVEFQSLQVYSIFHLEASKARLTAGTWGDHQQLSHQNQLKTSWTSSPKKIEISGLLQGTFAAPLLHIARRLVEVP